MVTYTKVNFLSVVLEFLKWRFCKLLIQKMNSNKRNHQKTEKVDDIYYLWIFVCFVIVSEWKKIYVTSLWFLVGKQIKIYYLIQNSVTSPCRHTVIGKSSNTNCSIKCSSPFKQTKKKDTQSKFLKEVFYILQLKRFH